MFGVKRKQMKCTGVWASGTAYISLENVKVPKENLIGAGSERMHPAGRSGHGRALPSKVGDGKNRGVCHHGVTTVRPDAKRGRCGHLVSHERTRVSNIARNDEV